MRKLLLFSLLSCLISYGTFAQAILPTDYLDKSFHKERRAAFKELMPENSVAIVFAAAVRNRANDVDYIYHQDPNFYYLTGYKEPHAVLVIFSEPQLDADQASYDELIFVQERNEQAEMWTGKRMGIEGVKEVLGFTHVFNGSDFQKFSADFKSFSKVLFPNIKQDIRDVEGNQADLFDLVQNFYQKANITADYNPKKKEIYRYIKSTPVENSANVAQNLGRYLERNTALKSDPLLIQFVSAKDDATRKELKQKIDLQLESDNLDTATYNEILARLRETKTPEELKLLKKAIEISAVGQIEMMKAMHPAMSETEIQGVHEFIYKKYGAEYEGYPSIVGGGNNGCILHYIENNKPMVGQELVLMDLGAEYHGYSADVTRTIPANGVFSKEQKLIYDLVYKAQEAGIKVSTVGAPFSGPGEATRQIINAGLAELGIIKSASEKHSYFPHGTSHYLGLDVHDPGTYGAFQENTVITVEPGIYIPEGSACDKKWWGIAVRIEDDILITKEGPINLSAMAPRTSDAIEKMMRAKSVLNNLVLPNLD
jgi:Xaa-Pro aminopeptidase